MLPVYPINESVQSKYHGAGYALASIAGGQIVNLIYVEDAIPDFDGELSALPVLLSDARLGPTVRLLQATGEVSVGMCSCMEFVVL